ncbi:glycosyltransferase [Dellaglioa algida]|uniref:glycosyltransferase n=1 Tax=Dellaglioa algida TaxID=105612 RepID=UPI0024C4B170|nr:glycosyltransferase [Dellaglioa algida]MDK1725890.1 glycosyltransferase [Dellaglioa algida]
MRIVVNDIAASKDSGGAFSILSDFYEDVKKNGNEHEWVFLVAADYFEETDNIKVNSYPEIKKSWLKRLLFDFNYGKKIINQLEPDIYFSIQNTATLGVKAKQYVYLHQALPYQINKNFSFFKKNEIKYAIYQKIIGKIFNFLIKKTKATIIVQTEWMKSALIKKNISDEKKVIVVAPMVNKISDSSFSDKKENEQKQFFYPAGKYIYKDHETLFNVFLKFNNDVKLILTLDKSDFKRDIVPNNVNFVGKLTREEVFNYYGNSVLVFPSYIETYGMPLMEARKCSQIIFARNTLFSKEILDGYENAYFFNDGNELEELINRYIEKKIIRKEVKNKNYDEISLVSIIVDEGELKSE